MMEARGFQPNLGATKRSRSGKREYHRHEGYGNSSRHPPPRRESPYSRQAHGRPEPEYFSSGQRNSVRDGMYPGPPPEVQQSSLPSNPAAALEAGLMLLTTLATNFNSGPAPATYLPPEPEHDTYHGRSIPRLMDVDRDSNFNGKFGAAQGNVMGAGRISVVATTSARGERYDDVRGRDDDLGFRGNDPRRDGVGVRREFGDRGNRVDARREYDVNAGVRGNVDPRGEHSVDQYRGNVDSRPRHDVRGSVEHRRDAVSGRARFDDANIETGFNHNADARGGGLYHDPPYDRPYDHHPGPEMPFRDTGVDYSSHDFPPPPRDFPPPPRDYPPPSRDYLPPPRDYPPPPRDVDHRADHGHSSHGSRRRRHTVESSYHGDSDLMPPGTKHNRMEKGRHHMTSSGEFSRPLDVRKYDLQLKQPVMNRLGPSLREAKPLFDPGEVKVADRLGPASIESRLGPKQQEAPPPPLPPTPLLPDLRIKLKGKPSKEKSSPPQTPPVPNSLPVLVSRENKTLPNLSVPDFLKPGSSSGVPTSKTVTSKQSSVTSPLVEEEAKILYEKCSTLLSLSKDIAKLKSSPNKDASPKDAKSQPSTKLTLKRPVSTSKLLGLKVAESDTAKNSKLKVVSDSEASKGVTTVSAPVTSSDSASSGGHGGRPSSNVAQETDPATPIATPTTPPVGVQAPIGPPVPLMQSKATTDSMQKGQQQDRQQLPTERPNMPPQLLPQPHTLLPAPQANPGDQRKVPPPRLVSSRQQQSLLRQQQKAKQQRNDPLQNQSSQPQGSTDPAKQRNFSAQLSADSRQQQGAPPPQDPRQRDPQPVGPRPQPSDPRSRPRPQPLDPRPQSLDPRTQPSDPRTQPSDPRPPPQPSDPRSRPRPQPSDPGQPVGPRPHPRQLVGPPQPSPHQGKPVDPRPQDPRQRQQRQQQNLSSTDSRQQQDQLPPTQCDPQPPLPLGPLPDAQLPSDPRQNHPQPPPLPPPPPPLPSVPVTAVVEKCDLNTKEPCDSDDDSDCGLVIDEDADPGTVGDGEDEDEDEVPADLYPEPQNQPCKDVFSVSSILSAPNVSIMADSSSANVSSEASVSVVSLAKEKPKCVKSILSTARCVLTRPLLKNLHEETDLLKRLYDSLKILMIFVNGRESWRRKWLERIRVVFKSYSISSAQAPVKLKAVFRAELEHLKKQCGVDVNKWQEVVRRFCLLCSTLPQRKGDLWWGDLEAIDVSSVEGPDEPGPEEWSKAVADVEFPHADGGEVVILKEKSGPEVLVISSDEERDGLEEGEVLSDNDSPAVVKVEPDDRPGIEPMEPCIGNWEPVIREQVSGTGFDPEASCGEGSMSVCSTDPEASCGEGSMSVCSTASDDGLFQVLDTCEPQAMPPAGESASLDTSAKKVDQVHEREQDQGKVRAKASGDEDDVQAASLSPGELTPTPPASPKPQSSKSDKSQGDKSQGDKQLSRSRHPSASGGTGTDRHPSRHVPAKKTERPHARKSLPVAYRRNSRRSRSRSRERYRHHRKSRSPVQRFRRRSTKSPVERNRERRRARSSSPGHSRAKVKHSNKGRVQRREEEDDDLELLQLKKEVILSIMKKPDTESGNKAVSPALSNNISPSDKGMSKSASSSADISLGANASSSGNASPSVNTSSSVTEVVADKAPTSVEIVKKNDQAGKSAPATNKLPPDSVDKLADMVKIVREKKSTLQMLKAQSRTISPSGRSPRSSLNSSRVSSCVTSPISSPAHASSGDVVEDLQRLDSVKSTSSGTSVRSASIKVCPGRENTWKIDPFHITSSDADSDCEGGEGSEEQVGTGLSEISTLLAEARKAATQASNRVKTVSSSSTEDLNLPSPPAVLPLNQQQEYVQLKRLIALHEKKKRKDLKTQGNPKAAPSARKSNSSSIRKGFPLHIATPSGGKVLLQPAHTPATATDDLPLPEANTISDLSLPEASSVSDFSLPEANTISDLSLPEASSVPDLSLPEVRSVSKAAERELERKKRHADAMKKMDDLTKKRKAVKESEEWEQQKITALTHQLADCVSEIAEHEQNMERVQLQLASLQKELEVADVSLHSCEKRMGLLQDTVRAAQQKKAEYSAQVKEYEKLISEQLGQLSSPTQPTAQKVPGIEYESVSDSESPVASKPSMDSSIPSIAIISQQAEYEAISDSEGGAATKLAPPPVFLKTPCIEVEPISDAEVEDANVSVSSPMEVEPVSDAEVDTDRVGPKKNLFPSVETESVTDVECEVEATGANVVLREHDYSKSDTNTGSVSPLIFAGTSSSEPTAGDPSLTQNRPSSTDDPSLSSSSESTNTESMSPHQLTPGTVSVFAGCMDGFSPASCVEDDCEQEVCIVGEELEAEIDPSAVCRRVLPYPRAEGVKKSVDGKEASPKGKGGRRKDSTKVIIRKKIKKKDGSKDTGKVDKGVRRKPSKKVQALFSLSNARGLGTALNLAMQGALSPTLSILPSVQAHGTIFQDSAATPMQSPQDKVQPLLNSVVTLLTQQSVSNITNSTKSTTPGSSSLGPTSEELLHTVIDSYFHSCQEYPFTLSNNQPPVYVLPRQGFSNDLALPIESSSVSEVALKSLTEGLALAYTDSLEDEPSTTTDGGSSGCEVTIPVSAQHSMSSSKSAVSDTNTSKAVEASKAIVSTSKPVEASKAIVSTSKPVEASKTVNAGKTISSVTDSTHGPRPSESVEQQQIGSQNVDRGDIPKETSQTSVKDKDVETAKKSTPESKKQLAKSTKQNAPIQCFLPVKVFVASPADKSTEAHSIPATDGKKQLVSSRPMTVSNSTSAVTSPAVESTKQLSKVSSPARNQPVKVAPPVMTAKVVSSTVGPKKPLTSPPSGPEKQPLKVTSPATGPMKQPVKVTSPATAPKKQVVKVTSPSVTAKVVVAKKQHPVSQSVDSQPEVIIVSSSAKKQPTVSQASNKLTTAVSSTATKKVKLTTASTSAVAEKQTALQHKKLTAPGKPANEAKRLSSLLTAKPAASKLATPNTVAKNHPATSTAKPTSTVQTSKAPAVSQAKKLVTVSPAAKPAIKQPAAAAAAPSTSFSSEYSCARTSGLRKAKVSPKAAPQGSLTQHSAGTGPSDVEGNTIAVGMIKQILSNKSVSAALTKTGCVESVQCSTTGSAEFSPFAFLNENSVIKTPSLVPVQASVPDKILSELDTPAPSTSAPITDAPHYQMYSSPLLCFGSYRLNPAFRSGDKISVSSLTYSNKLNPNKIICKFELTGVCNNQKCTAQHIRDLGMSKEELVKDLVSYAPTLAGCTDEDLVAATEPSQVKESITDKVSSYSSRLLERYGDRVSEEELYKLVVHDANTERMKSKTRREFVHFDDQPWTMGVAGAGPVKSLPGAKAGLGEGGVGDSDIGPGIGDILVSPPTRMDERRRYFEVTKEETAHASSESHASLPVLTSAQKLIREKKFSEATTLLEKALDEQKTCKELWICYLRLKSQIVPTSQLPELYQLFGKAITTSQSYSVILETIRLARCYKSQLKMVSDGLVQVMHSTSMESAVRSTLCLELFVNLILLNLQAGKVPLALKYFNQARLPTEDSPNATLNFTGLLQTLARGDRMIFSLCHLCVLYMGQLPGSLFGADAYHTLPVRICSFKPFAVPFSTSVTLLPHDYKKILRLIKFYFDLFQDPELPSSKDVELNLPLYKNLLLFEAVHGTHQKTINMLSKLTGLCPNITDLWMTYARMQEVGHVDGTGVLKQAIRVCPRRAEFYYFAARLELSRGATKGVTGGKNSEGGVDRAVKWLVVCIKGFYTKTPEERLSMKRVLILYRKLLNQLIGYDQTIPPFADKVDPKNLGDQLAPLWMCYCLLVELTVAPSSPSARPGVELLFHQSAEETYEAALHHVLSQEGHKDIWREYIYYVRAKGVETARGWRMLLDCVQRCVLDVEWRHNVPSLHVDAQAGGGDSDPTPKPADTYEDYTFHNEMISVLTDCLSPSSPYKLALLRKFARLLPNNTMLLSRVVRCALHQTPVCTQVAQTCLAEYLALHPYSPHLWQLAIETELQLKHIREARWMFNRALQYMPVHAKLWTDFLVFELKQAEVTPQLTPPMGVSRVVPALPTAASLQRILALVRNARQFGVDLTTVLRGLVSNLPTPKTN